MSIKDSANMKPRKAILIWLLVVGVLIGNQLAPEVCASTTSQALSLLVGYVIVGIGTFCLTAGLDI